MPSQSHASDHAPRRRGTKLFAAAMLVSQLCALGRYTILARILGPEQLGLAATLILTAQFFDTVTDNGSDRFLIQSSAGADPAAQALVQLIAIGRGTVIAALLVLLSWPIAAFFREPVLRGALAALALAPLIGGLMHYDFRRRQRDQDFRGEGSAVLVAELASLGVTVLAALVVRDFTAVVYGLMSRSIALVMVSHLTASRRYAVRLAREHAPALWRFGAPLLANGVILFLGAQSDRLLIGRLNGLEQLGRYSAILLPVLYPCAMIMRFIGGMYLPRVAADAPGRRDAEDEMASVTLLAAVMIAAGFALVAPFAVPFIFGPAFAGEATLMGLVGIYQSTRLIRTGPTIALLGIGASRDVLIANLARLAAIPLALIAFAIWKDVIAVIAAFATGELLALIVGQILVDRQARESHPRMRRHISFCFASMTILLACVAIDRKGPLLGAIGMVGLAAVVVAITLGERQAVGHLLRIVRMRPAKRP